MTNKILIVDDQLSTRKALYEKIFAESTRKRWYELKFVTTGEDALTLIKNDRKREIILILLDLRLEGAMINGVEMANILAQSHIERKIIVCTAHPEWVSDFTDLANKHIVSVVQRLENSSLYLKDICDAFIMGQETNIPGTSEINKNSKKPVYATVQKLAKALTEEQRYNLYLTLLPYFTPQKLRKLQQEIPKKIDEVIESSFERNVLKQWVHEQQDKGYLLEKVPSAQYLVDPYIEVIKRKNKPGTDPKKTYIEYFLRWSEEGKHKSKYLKKFLVQSLPPEFQEPWNHKQDPNSFYVVYREQG